MTERQAVASSSTKSRCPPSQAYEISLGCPPSEDEEVGVPSFLPFTVLTPARLTVAMTYRKPGRRSIEDIPPLPGSPGRPE